MRGRSVELSPAQRREVERLTKTGKASANQIAHAHILLQADRGPQGPGWPKARIVEAYAVSASTVERVCRRFTEEGLDAALVRRPQPLRPQKRKLDGEQEAQLIALLCHEKPEGAERWSLRVVAGKLIELEIVESVSHETVRQVLKKTNLNRG